MTCDQPLAIHEAPDVVERALDEHDLVQSRYAVIVADVQQVHDATFDCPSLAPGYPNPFTPCGRYCSSSR